MFRLLVYMVKFMIFDLVWVIVFKSYFFEIVYGRCSIFFRKLVFNVFVNFFN